MARTVSNLGRVFRTSPHAPAGYDNDTDARRIRAELNAIRARFQDHA